MRLSEALGWKWEAMEEGIFFMRCQVLCDLSPHQWSLAQASQAVLTGPPQNWPPHLLCSLMEARVGSS